MERRTFLKHSVGLAAASALATSPTTLQAAAETKRLGGTRIKLALNAYSFNAPLMSGKMKLEDLVDYCANHGIDGLDTTGYYFAGYPAVPSDDYIFKLKRRAYLNGVTINCTGVRNDFTTADTAVRQKHVKLVKDWIDVAAKLGASVVRVFSGAVVPGETFDQGLSRLVSALRECADYGGQRGVIVGLQHHHDFLKTADETIRTVEAVNSEWLSVILDVGSLRQGDPYAEIEKLLPYACTWQIKEHVYFGTRREAIDLPRVRAIIEKVGFRGFLPVESLEPGDPSVVVTRFVQKVRQAMS